LACSPFPFSLCPFSFWVYPSSHAKARPDSIRFDPPTVGPV
jgi:hypothetical protein